MCKECKRFGTERNLGEYAEREREGGRKRERGGKCESGGREVKRRGDVKAVELRG